MPWNHSSRDSESIPRVDHCDCADEIDHFQFTEFFNRLGIDVIRHTGVRKA